MKRFLFGAVLLAVLAARLVGAELKPLRFEAKVVEASLDRKREFYRIAFREKAAFYRVRKARPAAACLLRGVADKKPVQVVVDRGTGEILECSL